VGKGALRAVPTIFPIVPLNGGHATLCPPYGLNTHFANSFKPRVRANAHEHRILAAGRLGDDVFNTKNLANNLTDFHGHEYFVASSLECEFISAMVFGSRRE
jgi:hypothetical protein